MKLKPRKRLRKTSEDYKNEAFELLLARFDRVDQDNKDIKDGLQKHIEKDEAVHKVVSRQSTYWGLLIGLGGPLVLGIVAWFQGLFK